MVHSISSLLCCRKEEKTWQDHGRVKGRTRCKRRTDTRRRLARPCAAFANHSRFFISQISRRDSRELLRFLSRFDGSQSQRFLLSLSPRSFWENKDNTPDCLPWCFGRTNRAREDWWSDPPLTPCETGSFYWYGRWLNASVTTGTLLCPVNSIHGSSTSSTMLFVPGPVNLTSC
jgi:hypothetical protein